MRVTGGILRGRRIMVPGNLARPSQDRVREALFSVLGNAVEGAEFLDLFAGTGAVGLEAWSRGAGFVCWVESNRRVLSLLRSNLRLLCGDSSTTQIVGADAARFLRKGLAKRRFDIIFADPPYDKSPVFAQGPMPEASRETDRRLSRVDSPGQGTMDWKRRGRNAGWLNVLLDALICGDVLRHDGLFVMERRARRATAKAEHGRGEAAYEMSNRHCGMDNDEICTGWRVINQKTYGETSLIFVKRDTNGSAKV